MKISEILSLFKRNLVLTIILIIVIELIGFAFLHITQFTKTSNEIFYSVSAKNKITDVSSPYGNLQASDQFAESIQGWFKDKAFLDQITNKGLYKTNIRAKKQEKENIIISFSSETEKEGLELFNNISTTLQKQLNQYNLSSDSDFYLAISNFYQQKNQSPYLLYGLILLIIGLILTFSTAYISEVIADKIISENQLKYSFSKLKIISTKKELDLKEIHHDFPDFIAVKLGKTTLTELKLKILKSKNLLVILSQ